METFLIRALQLVASLSILIVIHEFGHFLFAKLSNTYVYEFSVGMGKKIFGKKKEGSETEFCVRAIPLGGYVMIAGEDTLDDEIPADRQMCNKNFFQRFMILFAGAFFNFIFAFIILFVSALIYGAVSMKPYIGDINPEYPAYTAGLEKGDLVLSINDQEIKSWDKGLVILQTTDVKPVVFEVQKENGDILEYSVTPILETDEDGNKSYKFGISTMVEKEYGFVNSLKYACNKTVSLFGSMWDTIKYLFQGKVGVNQLSGPVGIYSIVDSQAEEGLESILYLIAYLSINVGLINLLPFPAFDGGRILFLFIEKIFRKPVSKKVEGIIHTVGFFLILALLAYVTLNDIVKLF